MTAIELLAATVLASMLMLLMLGVLNSVAKQRKAAQRLPGGQEWRRQLSQQLHWDLSHARWMRWQSRELALAGFGSRDPGTGVATHGPSEVVYRVRRVAGISSLVRTERYLGRDARQSASSNLVCTGVEAIHVGSSDTAVSVPAGQGMTIPARLHVTLLGGPNQSILETDISLRLPSVNP